jgi:hypothetical protein
LIETRYHDRVNVLQALNGSCEITESALAPFDRVEWYQLLAETGLFPLVAIASDADAEAALALTEECGLIASLTNWYSFIWRPFVSGRPKGDALLAAIARALKLRAHRVTLKPVPDEDGSATLLAAAFRVEGWLVDVSVCDINHICVVNGRSFAEYWAARPGPLRSTLKRKGRKVETRIVTGFNPVLWEAYERIYAASWKPAEGNPAMLRAFAEAEGRAGRLRLGIAFHENKPIAAQFWTVENGTAYIHKLAHLESHKHLSAGTTLSAALFEYAIDTDKVALIDFGTGDQSYKADWMETTRPRYCIDCLNPTKPHAWAALAKRLLRRIGAPDARSLAPDARRG